MRWVLVLLVVGSFAQSALAANRYLDKARQAYEELDYDRVMPLLDKALGQANTPEVEVQIFELQAFMHVTYGRNQAAKAAFLKVLKRAPSYTLPPETSPKIVNALQRARKELEASQPPPKREKKIKTIKEPDNFVKKDEVPPPPPPPPSVSEESGPFYTTWWFWTGVGVVAAGAGVTTWLLLRDTTPDHTHGPRTLP